MINKNIDSLIKAMIPPEREVYDCVKKQWDGIAKPIDGLGDMEDIICRMAAVSGHFDRQKLMPAYERRTLLVFLSDNGIVDEGVSQSDASVTKSVAEAMANMKSTVCVMSKKAGVKVHPVDVGMKGEKVDGIEDRRIRDGSRDFYIEPAMTYDETIEAIFAGFEAAKAIIPDNDILLLGEMGIGNTSTATAVSCALLDMDPAEVVGRGAGLTDDMLKKKAAVIKEALKKHEYDKENPVSVLSCFGGYDIASMVGAIFAAASLRIPVVIDGLITLAAVLVAQRLSPGIREYCIASHNPGEKMGQRILKELEMKAPIDANLALGEGTGAVLLIPMIDVCMNLYENGLRFDGLGIDNYQRYK